jgi:hypothetical protein
MGRQVADDRALWDLAVSIGALLEGLCLQYRIDPSRTPDVPIGEKAERWSLFSAAAEAMLLAYTSPLDGAVPSGAAAPLDGAGPLDGATG